MITANASKTRPVIEEPIVHQCQLVHIRFSIVGHSKRFREPRDGQKKGQDKRGPVRKAVFKERYPLGEEGQGARTKGQEGPLRGAQE